MNNNNLYQRGHIFKCNFEGVGSEQKGLRPCLIISNNTGNTCGPTVTVVPITSKTKKRNMPTHVEIDVLDKPSIVLVEAIRTIDKSRFVEYCGSIPTDVMKKVDRAIHVALGLQ